MIYVFAVYLSKDLYVCLWIVPKVEESVNLGHIDLKLETERWFKNWSCGYLLHDGDFG